MEIPGPGFTLRGWKSDDAGSLQKHANNKKIADFLFDRFPSPYSLDNAFEWIKSQSEQSPVVNFAIDINGEVCGAIGLDLRGDIYRKSPLLGYWLSEMYWGRGIMPEAVKLITEYAFTTLDIVRIQAGILSNNPKSMRVVEKAGYVRDAVLKNNVFKNGVVLDEYIYAVVKDQKG